MREKNKKTERREEEKEEQVACFQTFCKFTKCVFEK